MSSLQHHEHDVRCPIIPVANPPAQLHKSLPPTRSSTEVAGLEKPTGPSVGKGPEKGFELAVRSVPS